MGQTKLKGFVISVKKITNLLLIFHPGTRQRHAKYWMIQTLFLLRFEIFKSERLVLSNGSTNGQMSSIQMDAEMTVFLFQKITKTFIFYL